MELLNLYLNKQKNPDWTNKFQSIGKGYNGKFFNCLNSNFRSLNSYYKQLDAFKIKDGLKRSEWNDFQNNGQEADKHRIQYLLNAKLIIKEGERYFITDRGKVALSIFNDDILTDKEKWVLMFLLVLDYSFEDNDLDLIKSVLDFTSDLENAGVGAKELIKMLKESISLLTKKEIFKSEIFWVVSFFKDSDFLKVFLSSTKKEKEELYKWVLLCTENKKSQDCVAHKYVSGGVYTASMFNEDVNMILLILILISLQDKKLDNFLMILSKLYKSSFRILLVKEIIDNNYDIFISSYSNSIGVINNILQVEV